MAESDSTQAPQSSLTKKESMPLPPIGSRLTELSESRSELLTRIQSIKQDVQSWRSKLDTQVKVYADELTELKKSLNVEVEQLRSDFQGLRTSLQQQQVDVTTRLRKLGLVDLPIESNKEAPSGEAGGNDTEARNALLQENGKETAVDNADVIDQVTPLEIATEL
ncbi:hypothetical protein ACHQM5_026570 [Ranunculus cassubicifolius]